MIDEAAILNAHILIVDVQPANVAHLTQMLHTSGYPRVSSSLRPQDVGPLHREHCYDLILIDLEMPVTDGIEVMQALKADSHDAFMPVIVITGQPGHRLQALQMGARDYVSKPYDLPELRLRIRNTLEVQLLYKLLKRSNAELELRVAERTAELRESEARFRALTELASDWYWEQDDSGNFTKFTGPVLEMLGNRMETAPEDTPKDAVYSQPGGGWDTQQHEELKTRIADREPFLDFLLCRTRNDGMVQRFYISGEPMFNRGNKYIGYRGVGLEITHRS
jgi:PAS domain S-box-containing protein